MSRVGSKKPPGRICFSMAHKPECIEDCEILLCRGDYWISHAFEFLTRGRYSHAAIAAWWEPRAGGHPEGRKLMLLQAEAFGIQAVPLERTVNDYPGKVECCQLAPWYREVIDLDKVLWYAKTGLGRKFGYVDALREVLNRIPVFATLKVPDDNDVPRRMFCSQYVSWCFRKGGEGKTYGDVLAARNKVHKERGLEEERELPQEVARLIGKDENGVEGIALTSNEDTRTFPEDIRRSPALEPERFLVVRDDR